MWVSKIELEHALGKDAAATLCRCLGGLELYIPSQGADMAHRICKIVGPRAFALLCQMYGGTRIVVPNERGIPTRNKVLEMVRAGKSKTEIALACDVSERYVYILIKEEREARQRERQLTLL